MISYSTLTTTMLNQFYLRGCCKLHSHAKLMCLLSMLFDKYLEHNHDYRSYCIEVVGMNCCSHFDEMRRSYYSFDCKYHDLSCNRCPLGETMSYMFAVNYKYCTFSVVAHSVIVYLQLHCHSSIFLVLLVTIYYLHHVSMTNQYFFPFLIILFVISLFISSLHTLYLILLIIF